MAQEIDSLREIPASDILARLQRGESIEYNNVIITGDVNISGLDLPRENESFIIYPAIEIKNSQIQGIFNFNNVIFEEEVNFVGTHFTANTSFMKAQFANFTDFTGAHFYRNAEFNSAQFDESAIFNDCQFNGVTDFREARFNGYAYFCKSQFSGWAYFSDAEFGMAAIFVEAEFNGVTDYMEAQFNGKVLTFRDAKFKDSRFKEYACRMAKNILEKNGDREEAGYHFYCEMDAKRMQKPRYIRYPEYVFIQRIFGYGVHPWWLWAWWFFFVGIFAAIYWIGNGVIGAAQPLDYIWFSITVAVTPGFAGYKPTPGFFQVVAGLEAIFGTFMWAAFIATFARKYMR